MGSETRRREDRIQRWYHGGVAACGATCFTHPLDLLKVQLQTQQEHAKIVSIPILLSGIEVLWQ